MESHKNVTNKKDSLPLCSSNTFRCYWFIIPSQIYFLLQQYITYLLLGLFSIAICIGLLFSIIIKMGIQMTVLLAFAL
jgi:hypothetical protein